MVVRIAGIALSLYLAACAGTPGGSGLPVANGYAPPLGQGMARLRIVRSDEVLAVPQAAQIRLSGKFVAELDPGTQHLVDLPAGRYAVTATQRSAASAVPLRLDLAAGESYRVLVTLDPKRFPAYDGPGRPFRFLKESLDAPHDDRQSLFRLQQVSESQRARARPSAARAESELDDAVGRPAGSSGEGR